MMEFLFVVTVLGIVAALIKWGTGGPPSRLGVA